MQKMSFYTSGATCVSVFLLQLWLLNPILSMIISTASFAVEGSSHLNNFLEFPGKPGFGWRGCEYVFGLGIVFAGFVCVVAVGSRLSVPFFLLPRPYSFLLVFCSCRSLFDASCALQPEGTFLRLLKLSHKIKGFSVFDGHP